MSIALVLRWHLYNHFNLDNLNILALWPKWMGQGTGAVHVKSSPVFFYKTSNTYTAKYQCHWRDGKPLHGHMFPCSLREYKMEIQLPLCL